MPCLCQSSSKTTHSSLCLSKHSHAVVVQQITCQEGHDVVCLQCQFGRWHRNNNLALTTCAVPGFCLHLDLLVEDHRDQNPATIHKKSPNSSSCQPTLSILSSWIQSLAKLRHFMLLALIQKSGWETVIRLFGAGVP